MKRIIPMKVIAVVVILLVIGYIGIFGTRISGRTVAQILASNISKDSIFANSKIISSISREIIQNEEKDNKSNAANKTNAVDATSTATTVVETVTNTPKPASAGSSVSSNSGSGTTSTIKDITAANANSVDVVSSVTTVATQNTATSAGSSAGTTSNTATTSTVKDITVASTKGTDVVSSATPTVPPKTTTSTTGSVNTTSSNTSTISTANYIGDAKVKAILLQKLKGAINDKTAAIVFVVSHHTVQSAMISLKEITAVANEYNIPVIVDAASEYDLKGFLKDGSDIVIYSGHKFLEGPTSGIICGKKELVRACYYQEKGIGRGMKIGKESILGVMEALEQWAQRDHESIKRAEDKRIAYGHQFLNTITGFRAIFSQDPTNNPITRLKVYVDPTTSPLTAFEISVLLSSGNPSIKVRNHHVDCDYFFLDACNLLDGEMEVICDRIKEIIEKPVKNKYKTQNLADIEINSLLLWPDK